MADIEELDKAVSQLKAEGKYMEALDLVEQGLIIRKEKFGEDSEEVHKSYRQLCELCNILATFYLQRDDSYLALDLLKRAEVLSEGDSHAQAITFNNLSCYYRKANKTKIALKYLKSALSLEQDIPNTHLNLCAVYSQIGRHDMALSHVMQSVIILQENVMNLLESDSDIKDVAPVLAVAYHNMAVELEYLKRNSEALGMYAKAVSFADEYLAPGHPVMDNVKSAYENALKESQEGKKKKKTKGIKGLKKGQNESPLGEKSKPLED
jgi:tetratricopeptide (TPR) repeat protein